MEYRDEGVKPGEATISGRSGVSSAQGSDRRAPLRVIADSVPITNVALLVASTGGLVLTARVLGVDGRGEYLTWSAWSALVGTLALLGTQPFVVVASAGKAPVSLRDVQGLLLMGLAVAMICTFLVLNLLRAPGLAILGGMVLAMSGPVVALNASVQQANGDHHWRFNAARAIGPVCGLTAVILAWWVLDPGAAGTLPQYGRRLLCGGLYQRFVHAQEHWKADVTDS